MTLLSKTNIMLSLACCSQAVGIKSDDVPAHQRIKSRDAIRFYPRFKEDKFVEISSINWRDSIRSLIQRLCFRTKAPDQGPHAPDPWIQRCNDSSKFHLVHGFTGANLKTPKDQKLLFLEPNRPLIYYKKQLLETHTGLKLLPREVDIYVEYEERRHTIGNFNVLPFHFANGSEYIQALIEAKTGVHRDQQVFSYQGKRKIMAQDTLVWHTLYSYKSDCIFTGWPLHNYKPEPEEIWPLFRHIPNPVMMRKTLGPGWKGRAFSSNWDLSTLQMTKEPMQIRVTLNDTGHVLSLMVDASEPIYEINNMILLKRGVRDTEMMHPKLSFEGHDLDHCKTLLHYFLKEGLEIRAGSYLLSQWVPFLQ